MPRFTYLKLYSNEHYVREIFEKYVLKLKVHSVKWSQLLYCIIIKNIIHLGYTYKLSNKSTSINKKTSNHRTMI